MQFYEARTLYQILKARSAKKDWPSELEWYTQLVFKSARDKVLDSLPERDKSGLSVILASEGTWVNNGKPYYQIWPVAAGVIAKMNLNLPTKAFASAVLEMPEQFLLVRFAEKHVLSTSVPDWGDEFQIGALLLGYAVAPYQTEGISSKWIDQATEKNPVVLATVLAYPTDWHKVRSDADYVPAVMQLVFYEEGVSDILQGPNGLNAGFSEILQYVVGIPLFSQSSDLLSPDVLSKDRSKWEATRDESIVARALRRGKKGWDVGRYLVTSPHFRRPHMALRHTGKGRSIPRIVPVKGAVIHRELAQKIPTGYLGESGGGE